MWGNLSKIWHFLILEQTLSRETNVIKVTGIVLNSLRKPIRWINKCFKRLDEVYKRELRSKRVKFFSNLFSTLSRLSTLKLHSHAEHHRMWQNAEISVNFTQSTCNTELCKFAIYLQFSKAERMENSTKKKTAFQQVRGKFIVNIGKTFALYNV